MTHRFLTLWCPLFFWVGWYGENGVAGQTNAVSYPLSVPKVVYTNAAGEAHLYLVQEPQAGLRGDAPVLIYMHGAGGKEEQGMNKLFPDLRPLLDRLGWLYVCPRDVDFPGLRRDLETHYGKRTIYLSGASKGGGAVVKEAMAHPEAYSGLILMCPAVRQKSFPQTFATNTNSLPFPVWMIGGELDHICVETCRFLKRSLEERHQRVFYHEIPGGNHNDPCSQISWVDALEFVTGKPL